MPFLLLLALGALFGYGVYAQSGAVSASIVSPANGALTGDSLWVVAKATSTLEIRRFSARVEGREVDLAFSPAAYYDNYSTFPGWTNSISLVGLARGNQHCDRGGNGLLRQFRP